MEILKSGKNREKFLRKIARLSAGWQMVERLEKKSYNLSETEHLSWREMK